MALRGLLASPGGVHHRTQEWTGGQQGLIAMQRFGYRAPYSRAAGRGGQEAQSVVTTGVAPGGRRGKSEGSCRDGHPPSRPRGGGGGARIFPRIHIREQRADLHYSRQA